MVEQARAGWPGEIRYAALGENLGPSGGWAHAVDVAAPLRNLRGDWVLVIDDDDPIDAPGLIARLLDHAERQGSALAGIGLRGARWDRPRARLRRIEPPEGEVERVDYLASNGAALYAWRAISATGFFNPELFFGFEDLDFGLRLTSAKWVLVVAPQPSLQSVADTAVDRTPWREYYKTRALVWILGHREGRYAQGVTLLRSVLLGGIRLAVLDRRPSLSRARFLGAWDGLGGQLGVRRYRPAANPPKNVARGETS